MCPLSTLPDLCVLAILDRVPVHDLYHTVPLVCKRWTTLHHTACHRRKTLILVTEQRDLSCAVDGPYTVYYTLDLLKYAVREDGTPLYALPAHYQNSCLVCPFSTARLVKILRLTELFCNVQTLKIIQFDVPVYELFKVSVIIQCMFLSSKQRVQKLQLLLDIADFTVEEEEEGYDDALIESSISGIMEQINDLMSNTLKSLSLNLDFPYEFNGKVSLDLKILSKLESFTFELYGLARDDQYDVNEPLRHLQAYNSKKLSKIIITHPLKLDSLLKLSPEIAKKFLKIKIDDEIVWENLENFKLICHQFTWLTVLSVNICGTGPVFSQVISSLAKLKHLSHMSMKIDLNFEDQEDNQNDQDNDQENDQKAEENEIQLKSLLALSLFIESKSHHNLAQLNLPAIMPNVQVILLWHNSPRCTECGYGPFTMDEIKSFVEIDEENQMLNHPMIQQMQLCMKQTRRSLIEFKKLRKLNVNKLPKMVMDVLGDADEKYAIELTKDDLI